MRRDDKRYSFQKCFFTAAERARRILIYILHIIAVFAIVSKKINRLYIIYENN